jgi:hypothetical protein
MGEVSTRLYIGSNPVAETVFNGEFVAINPYTIPIDFIVAAGGGGGGSSNAGGGGGGGAGGVVTGSFVSFLNPLTIVVGAGGPAGFCGSDPPAFFDAGANGSNSYIVQPTIAHIALGGGGGGGVSLSTNGKDGGSGGGGAMIDTIAHSGGTGLQPTAASVGFGNDGANASGVFQSYGGAGGGAGGAASGFVNGPAYQWLDGLDYGRGGSAGSGDSCAFQVPANSANGGGPCESSIYIGPYTQCGGASGIVKLRYPGSTPLATGGTITTTGGYTYHTFTSSGTLTWQIK